MSQASTESRNEATMIAMAAASATLVSTPAAATSACPGAATRRARARRTPTGPVAGSRRVAPPAAAKPQRGGSELDHERPEGVAARHGAHGVGGVERTHHGALPQVG